MASVQTGMWDPRPPSKHAAPLPQPHPPNSRPTHVSTATPAKRITFYKSGDSQFGGVRMAVHKRSFKCFDALLDDLSQKVPLPFGVRTVTTPRGTHSIKHLEQLRDGGCYLCSDRRQAKPVNMELARKRPSIWCYDSRRPQRPDTSPTTPSGHLPYRQRRVLLVKNSEPGMRRSVVLSRRSTRSLRAFLDEVSEVMQFHVRKLYTAEGRRIDSVQSLITCPGVLVCVGREAFSPTLVNFIRKSSEEKLPGLGSRSPGLGPRTPGNGARSPATQGARSPPHGAQSRASEYSEGHESKKNVNFGLETKKSIIHPRSDSSNRSTHFSLSSEKSYSNGVSAYSQAKPAIMNEDIEKRVIVNKDGSLSVEMRVRFRLQNDETLQWSTQIKKSPSLTNECCPLGQAQPHYLQQGQSESCSDPDSTSFEPEGVGYSSQHVQCGSEGSRCPCCHQRWEPQYDLWENPAHSHKQPPVPPPHTSSHTHTMRHTHSSSSSSSCNSRRVVRCRAQLSSCRGGSGLERRQLVQEEMCVTEQVERRVEVEQDGNTRVKVCSVSRCHSRSEVVATDSNLPPSMEGELMMEEEGDRPLSAVSSSSHVLQSLKEDEDDDLPPSASQCCHSNEPSPSPTFHLSDKPTSDVSAVSVHSNKHRKDGDRAERGSRAASVARSCQGEADVKIPHSEEEGTADDEDEEIKRVVSGVSGYRGPSAGSLQSRASSVCPDCCGCKSGANSDSNSRTSQRSHHSHQASPKPTTPLSNQDNLNNCSDDDGSDVSAGSTQSNKTNLTNHGRFSAIANVLEDRESCAMSRTSSPHAAEKEKERAPSATSATSRGSNRSRKHGCDGGTGVPAGGEEERSHGAISAQSNLSAKSSKSYKSNCSCAAQVPDIRTREDAEEDNAVERAPSSKSAKSGASSRTRASVTLGIKVASLTDKTDVEKDEIHETTPSALSVKSNGSDKPSKAERPDSVLSVPGAKAADEAVTEATGQDEGMEAEERAASATSDKSNLSAKSNKSQKKKKASERSLSPRSETGGDGEKRAASQMSGRSVKSNMSVKSSKSRKSNYNGNESEASPSFRVAEENENETVQEETQQRPGNVISPELENEESEASTGSSKSHCDENTGVSSETGGNTGDGEKAEDRAASALSGESASSAKSRCAKCETRVASPAKVTAKLEVDRSPSGMSGKSRASAKSSKSQKSNCTVASPNPSEGDAAAVDKNGEEKQKQERVASAMSVRSKSSHKSNSSKNLKSASPSPNIVTIRTPEGNDKDGNETTERAPSAASAKSEKSTASALSHKSNPNTATDIAIIESADADEEVVEDNAPRNKSSEPANSLSPKTCSPRTHSPKAPAGETRGPSALSVHSTTSAKSGRSKCRCGAASTLEKAVKEHKGEVEGENEKHNEELQSEEAPERAASILSSSSKRRRRESGGTEQPLSRNSSGSVSLGLPEDQDTGDSDSGKSSVSFHINAESKSGVKTATPAVPRSAEESVVKEDVEGTASIISQKSSMNGSKKNVCHSSPAVDIPTIETPGGSEDKGEGKQKTERATSAFSAKSSTSHRSSCNCSVTAAPQMLDVKRKEQHASASSAKAGNDLETGSVEIASTTKSSNKNVPDNRTLSAMSSASAKVRSKSPASASVKNASVAKTTAGDPENNDTVSRSASKAKGEGDNAGNKAASVHSKSPCCLRPESAASARSGSKMKASNGNKGEDPVKCHKSSGNVKTTKTSSPCPLHSSRPCSKVESCADSILSHSLSAADLLKETMDAARPHGRQCKASNASDKPRSEKSGRRNSNQVGQEDLLDLTTACLPNASPSEVVSDWLRSIPANSGMLALGDELNEEEEEEQRKPVEGKPWEEATEEEEGSPEDEKGDKEEKVEAEEKEEGVGCDAAEEEKSSDPAPDEAVASSRPDAVLLTGESMARNWNSSAAVMKVLLSSSLGRCRSMPEVSPVYGRRLSTSARGLLDCLAQLQLIEPAVSLGCDQQKNQHYEDITAILQSLWLTEPRNIEAKETKDVGDEQVTPPRSSSGVDMSSGSGGSGRENGIQDGDETKQKKDTESLQEGEGAEKVVGEEEEGNAEGGHKEIQDELDETPTEQAKADTAEEAVQSEEQSTVTPSLDSPKDAGTPSSSDKSSANSSSKSPTDNERETLEDSSSGTPPTVLRAPLSKRLSQDPDPVWILNLLKKLEKQFMTHYINVMAEFKVRWDLDDSLILDTMISELREEVSRRIQGSIEREIRKIQSRAGRAGRPRPPQGGNLSRDSIMTEKRRQMLKIMKNQSVKTADSLSDGETTGEFSDQRSDDEYCPCDACVRKKMAARPLATNPMASEAPVMMEFDLLKILQLKKSPSPAPAAVTRPAEGKSDSVVLDEEGRNLEVVQEEEEEEEEEDKTKEDIKADVVLEETIREEDEEMGEEEDCGEAGEEEEVEAKEEEKEENSVGDEEHAEGETGDEEDGEEGTSENGEEEEEEDEEETECHCQSARKEECEKEGEEGEESSDNTGEDETKDDEERAGEEEGESNEGDSESREEEEEESDKETVKEATAVEGETSENGEGKDEKEEEEAEVEECEASEKADGEETSSRQSREESGEAEDDGAAKDAANEESAQVEGNASASAEDEDDGDESREDDKGGESEEQGGEALEEGRTSSQGRGVTEGEEADAEDSSSPEEKEGGGHGGKEEVVEDAVEEFKPEKEEGEEEGGEVNRNKREDGALLHQITRTSVESQPGSLEDIDTDSPQNPVSSIEVPKMAAGASTGGGGGGAGQRRSRSPARVKRRRPKESDVEPDDF